MNIQLSVFNNAGNFAGNIALCTENEERVKTLLLPHNANMSAQNGAAVMTVRPYGGLDIPENQFFDLIYATMRVSGLLDKTENFRTGYGSMGADVEIEKKGDNPFALLRIYDVASNNDYINLTIGLDQPEQALSKINELAQGLPVLVAQCAECLIESVEQMVKEEVKEVVTKPTAPTVSEEAPKLQRPRVAVPSTNLPVVQHDVRSIVDEALAVVRKETPVMPYNTLLAVLKLLPENRSTPFDLIFEMSPDNYEQFVAEGLVTSILDILPESTISKGRIEFGNSNGYLRKIREVLASHGIECLSLTPSESGVQDTVDPERIRFLL